MQPPPEREETRSNPSPTKPDNQKGQKYSQKVIQSPKSKLLPQSHIERQEKENQNQSETALPRCPLQWVRIRKLKIEKNKIAKLSRWSP